MGIHSITLIIVMICSIGLGVSQKHETDKLRYDLEDANLRIDKTISVGEYEAWKKTIVCLRNEQARMLEQIKVRQDGQNAMNEELASRTISLDNKLKELQNAIDDMK